MLFPSCLLRSRISIDHIQVNEHFNTVNRCAGSKLHCHRTSKLNFTEWVFLQTQSIQLALCAVLCTHTCSIYNGNDAIHFDCMCYRVNVKWSWFWCLYQTQNGIFTREIVQFRSYMYTNIHTPSKCVLKADVSTREIELQQAIRTAFNH